jgi:hypothetical protein
MRKSPMQLLFGGMTALLTVFPAIANACPLSGRGGGCAGSLLFGPTTLGVGAIAIGLGLVLGIATAKRSAKR